MDTTFSLPTPAETPLPMADRNRHLTETIARESGRLGRFIRQRVADRFRKQREVPLAAVANPHDDDAEARWLDDALPAADGGPEAAHLRRLWLDTMTAGLDELPAGPRDTFIAHEIDGRSFKELATASDVPLNTLLGWKRQAVLHLRERLRPLYDTHP